MSEQSVKEYRAGFNVPEVDDNEQDTRKPYRAPELTVYAGATAMPHYHDVFRQRIEELATDPELHQFTGME